MSSESNFNCCLNCNGDDDCTIDGFFCGQFTDITNQSCRELTLSYCSGQDLNKSDDDWLSRWPNDTTKGCWKAFNCNLFGNCNNLNYEGIKNNCNILPPVPYSVDNLNWAKNLLLNIVNSYKNLGYELGSSPDNKTYNSFQNDIFNNICCPYSAVCQDILRGLCKYKTFKQLNINPFLVSWCGCHLSSESYEKYTNIGLSRECTPYCHNKQTIPLNDSKLNPILCEQNICVIDDNTIRLINSQSNDLNINLTNICGSCSGNGSCQCYLDKNDIAIANSNLKNSNINLTNLCSNYVCQIDNPSDNGPSKIPVPCNSTELGEKTVNTIKNTKKENNFIIFLILFFGFLLLVVLSYFFIVFLNKSLYYFILLIITLLYFLISFFYVLFFW